MNERSNSASPSSSINPDTDFYLEFLDIAGPLAQGLKADKDMKRIKISSSQSQLQASILKVYLADHFDGVIICFDLNNLKSLQSLPGYFAIVESLVNRSEKHSLDKDISDMLIGKIDPSPQTIPIILLGCKRDLIDKNRA